MRQGGRPRVLLVDDDEHIIDFLALALEDEGFLVDCAPHGAAALERIAVQRPDVIILDLWMPVMDGWQFLQAYRQRPESRAAVIALTAAQYDVSRHTEVDADGFLTKPFALDALLELVHRHTGEVPAASPE